MSRHLRVDQAQGLSLLQYTLSLLKDGVCLLPHQRTTCEYTDQVVALFQGLSVSGPTDT